MRKIFLVVAVLLLVKALPAQTIPEFSKTKPATRRTSATLIKRQYAAKRRQAIKRYHARKQQHATRRPATARRHRQKRRIIKRSAVKVATQHYAPAISELKDTTTQMAIEWSNNIE